MGDVDSERFWDERARENALYFVDNGLDYEDPDTDAFWRRGEEVVERMLEMTDLSLDPGHRLVDVGCGVGRLTRALASRSNWVHGIDVSSEMLELAKRYNADLDNVDWLHGDGRGLTALGDASVDGCFSHVVFQHIPDPAITLNYIREMGRVLRPGGWALFQVSTDPRVHRGGAGRLGQVKSWLRPGHAQPADRAWWGSAVEIPALRAAAHDGNLELQRVLDQGSQYTTVLARRRS